MIQRIIATGFLGYHFVKTLFCRIFRIHRRGLKEFREDYLLVMPALSRHPEKMDPGSGPG